MIAVFPEVYDDELIYSWLSRYYVKSGSITLTYALEDLFTRHYTKPDIEFLNELKPEVLELMKKNRNMDVLIQKHTMFSAYGRFLNCERKQEAYQALTAMDGNFHNLLAVPRNHKGAGRYLRYCPACVKKDKEQYGETYWHRKHQIQGIQICEKHGCYLEDSDISMERKQAPGLWSAEAVIDKEKKIRFCKDKKEILLTEYLCKVFDKEMQFQNKVSVSDYIKLHLKGYYRSSAGASIHLEKFYQDYAEFYEHKNIMTKVQVQKVLNGDRYNFYDICKVAFFIGIDADKLVDIPDDISEDLKKPVYKQVADELGIDYELVEKIGEAVLQYYERREHVQRRKRTHAWDKMDKELLPKVKNTIRYLYGDGTRRPQRITVSVVAKEMNLPHKQFDKLPICKKEILEYQEDQKEYWARECVWAYKKLVQEGQPVNWKHIRELTNMRKESFDACKKYLVKHTDVEEAERIQMLI